MTTIIKAALKELSEVPAIKQKQYLYCYDSSDENLIVVEFNEMRKFYRCLCCGKITVVLAGNHNIIDVRCLSDGNEKMRCANSNKCGDDSFNCDKKDMFDVETSKELKKYLLKKILQTCRKLRTNVVYLDRVTSESRDVVAQLILENKLASLSTKSFSEKNKEVERFFRIVLYDEVMLEKDEEIKVEEDDSIVGET